MEPYKKRGYLNSEFRLFHLADNTAQEFEYHYHDFDKIIIFLRGNVRYTIEGRAYDLEPYDIVFINHHDIHRPEIDPAVVYERIVVYISPNFIKAYQTPDYDLSACFYNADEQRSHVLRMDTPYRSSLFQITDRLEHSFDDTAFANELYRQVLFLEFMIQLNRSALKDHVKYLDTNLVNTKIQDIIHYINQNLTSDLSVDLLAQKFYISKYHMMRLFKAETGCTVYSYIKEKRLLLAKDLLRAGRTVMQVCFDCGFKDYSTFSRAYKKMYGESPRQSIHPF